MRANVTSVERRYASRARVFARVRACTSVVHTYGTCMRVRRGLVAARLPASALGCAARQDVEPSATQPGDHPRVQPALLPFPPIPTDTSRCSSFSSSSSSSSYSSTTFATVCLGQSSRSHVFGKSLSFSLFIPSPCFLSLFLCPRSSFSRFSSAVASSFFLLATSPHPFPRDISSSSIAQGSTASRPTCLACEHSPGAVVPTCIGSSSPRDQVLLRTHGKHFFAGEHVRYVTRTNPWLIGGGLQG